VLLAGDELLEQAEATSVAEKRMVKRGTFLSIRGSFIRSKGQPPGRKGHLI
jgi:hypothetical protein